jgi:hypothetical protein
MRASREHVALLSRGPARAQRALAEMVTGIFSAWASVGGARPGGAPAPVYECAMSIGWCAACDVLTVRFYLGPREVLTVRFYRVKF